MTATWFLMREYLENYAVPAFLMETNPSHLRCVPSRISSFPILG